MPSSLKRDAMGGEEIASIVADVNRWTAPMRIQTANDLIPATDQAQRRRRARWTTG
jgi:hypothetical protein